MKTRVILYTQIILQNFYKPLIWQIYISLIWDVSDGPILELVRICHINRL